MIDRTNENGNSAINFGGTAIERIGGIHAHSRQALAALGFLDAEQVVAAMAVPGVKNRLAQEIGLPLERMDDLLHALSVAYVVQYWNVQALPF